jgi:hypothetical protein
MAAHSWMGERKCRIVTMAIAFARLLVTAGDGPGPCYSGAARLLVPWIQTPRLTVSERRPDAHHIEPRQVRRCGVLRRTKEHARRRHMTADHARRKVRTDSTGERGALQRMMTISAPFAPQWYATLYRTAPRDRGLHPNPANASCTPR